ncbi:TPA: DUF2806 domain-containing protein [Legionella pneumophila]|nr:DUF2806 domain-containing protein [Legionella pneumophila]
MVINLGLGELARPATVLVEKISNAIGLMYKPRSIKNIACAQAEADKIRPQSEIEIAEIRENALKRVVYEEVRNQKNINNIVQLACEGLKQDADASKIDDDWISHFFDKCKIISNAEMQSLWGRLLSSEANQPGSISRKTIELVSGLDKNDAQLFTNFCSFLASDGAGQIFPIILNTDHILYKSRGINFETLTHLEHLGLISFNPVTGFGFDISSQEYMLLYNHYLIKLRFTQLTNNLPTGLALLTRSGKQLAPISGYQTTEEILNYFIEDFKVKQIHAITLKIK